MIDVAGAAFSLLVAGGGVYGYAKARSIPSLVAGLTFGAILFIGSQKYSNGDPRILFGGSFSLAAIMGSRYANTGKFMPAGIICILSTAMAIRCGHTMWRRYNSINK
ncbi:unnamed protein product [Rodentolepis nana]|uniref:Transmembrane protein 14C n=1 Tax=Rodentolepis nana TaxID=102285 RepID=A0A0R3T573_RODNA|nr:unnamed protein product [Rodentolepis nana]